jgi:hypothetical protein
MEASELRLNNYVLEDGDVVLLDTNYDLFKCLVNVDRGIGFEPIPLTEEWLLKLGAKRDKIDNTYYLSELEIMLPNFFRYKTSIIRRIKYVHQLQNLYFALTGEELKQQEQ